MNLIHLIQESKNEYLKLFSQSASCSVSWVPFSLHLWPKRRNLMRKEKKSDLERMMCPEWKPSRLFEAAWRHVVTSVKCDEWFIRPSIERTIRAHMRGRQQNIMLITNIDTHSAHKTAHIFNNTLMSPISPLTSMEANRGAPSESCSPALMSN